jgi:hypothetical protein
VLKQVFITVVESVYSAVRTDFLYKSVFITVVESVYSAVRTDYLKQVTFSPSKVKILLHKASLLKPTKPWWLELKDWNVLDIEISSVIWQTLAQFYQIFPVDKRIKWSPEFRL